MKKTLLFIRAIAITLNGQTEENILTITNSDVATHSYFPVSGIKNLMEKEPHFKDLNKNSEIDKCEEWHLPVKRYTTRFNHYRR